MKVDITVPGVGESIKEGLLASWSVSDGDSVEEGQAIFELETDKTTLDVSSPAKGVVHIGIPEGTDVAIGDVVGFIDTEAAASAAAGKVTDRPTPDVAASSNHPTSPGAAVSPGAAESSVAQRVMPAAKAAAAAAGIDLPSITASGRDGMLTKADVQAAAKATASLSNTGGAVGVRAADSVQQGSFEHRKPLSRIRKAIAANLKHTQQELVLLTTFNEVDMSAAKALRKNYGEAFLAKFGVKLGFMSLFLKASAAALEAYPEINAVIDGNEVVYREKVNISVAVSTARGLVTPVIRDAASKSFADLETEIVGFAAKAANKTLMPDDLIGGSFAVTNGGVFGSLLSTPLPAPGQSAILGMHGIQDRPIAVNGEVVIHPMMYVALSYDHRLVDGKEAVGFLKMIKESVEHPERMMLGL